MANAEIITLSIVAWLLCGSLGASFLYAHMQRKYPIAADEMRTVDTASASVFILTGPISLLAVAMTGFYDHGLLFPGRKP